MNQLFRRIATTVSNVVGSPWSFLVALTLILLWLISGPIFGFSDTWQLIINTGTTIVTFLMVFLIQNTQNRDAKALHLKLDELIRISKGARQSMVDLEDLSDEELERLQKEFERLRKDHADLEDQSRDTVEKLDDLERTTREYHSEVTERRRPEGQPDGEQARGEEET